MTIKKELILGVVESGAAGLEAPERQPVRPEGRKTGARIPKKQTRWAGAAPEG